MPREKGSIYTLTIAQFVMGRVGKVMASTRSTWIQGRETWRTLPNIAALSDATFGQIITFGGRGMNRSVLMPAYQSTMTQDEISYLIAYIRTFGRRKPKS